MHTPNIEDEAATGSEDAADLRSSGRTRWSAAVPALLWAIGATLSCLAMLPLEPELLEEGVIVHFAQRMAQGEHLYRDLVFFTGPLPFELLALLFRLFGEEIAVARGAMAVLTGIAAASAYGLVRGTRCGALAHVAPAAFAVAPVLLFPLATIYYYSGIALHLSVAAGHAALRGLDDRRWAVAAGALAAGVALTKQSVGIVLAPGLVLVVAAHAHPPDRLRRVGEVVLGGGVVTAVTLAAYALRGDLGVFWDSMVVMPLSLGEAFGSPYPALWPVGVLGEGRRFDFYIPHLANLLAPHLREQTRWLVALTQTLFALPFAAFLVMAGRRLLYGPLPAAAWIAAVVLLSFLAQLFPRSDWGHLVFVLPPAVVLLVTTTGAHANGREVARPVLRAVFATAIVGLAGAGTIRLGLALHRAAGPAPLAPHVPQRAVSRFHQAPPLARAADYLRDHTEPGDAIFVARAEPLLYFATRTRNPTPYAGIVPGLGEVQERTIIEALEDVRYVVMSDRDSRELFYYREELPAVQRHLERYYRVAAPFRERPGWMTVLERGEDRGATAVDLFDRAPRAEAWVRTRRGDERRIERAAPKLPSRLNRRPLGMLVGARGGGLDYRLEIPEAAVFETSLGVRTLMSESRRFDQPRRSRFEVWVDAGEGPERVGSRELDLNVPEGRHWTPFQIDLSAYAGRTVDLRLALVPRYPLPRPAVAWWGSPRLVSRPDSPSKREVEPSVGTSTPALAREGDDPGDP